MKKIIIYTTSICPYCIRAKALFDRKNIKYQEINAEDEEVRNEMIEKTGGRRTVPQIFAGDDYLGDCDKIYELDRTGKLDKMIR